MAFLDATKGFLVVAMVIYHSLNYSSQYYLGFRYISFLPPSFIFITGFLISTVYLKRNERRPAELYARLLIRGVKLLALFTALNLAAQILRGGFADGVITGVLSFFAKWQDIYVLGSGRSAVFEVLLPISYLLLLAPLLIWLHHQSRFALFIAALGLIVLCLGVERLGGSGNLNLLSAGVLGMAVGQVLPNPVVLGRYWIAAVAAYAVYFPVGVSAGYHYLVQLLGACVALAMICALSIRISDQGWFQQRLVRLGQYSLLSYIAQIFLLQILLIYFRRPEPISAAFFVMLLTTLVLTSIISEATSYLRQRYSLADLLYRVVFP